MRSQAKLHDARHQIATAVPQSLQETFDATGWFLPRKETRSMSTETNRVNGLFLPYPLLGIFLTLFIVLGGGIIALYAQVTTMNATMLMRDSDQREAIKKLENKNDLLEVYIKDLREKHVEMRTELNQRRRGGS